ncbi:hypothetical protein RhoFasB10_00966 [Rhodococcus sp. B10]|nr:hypothetical protein [Rhodococcus sp. B10]
MTTRASPKSFPILWLRSVLWASLVTYCSCSIGFAAALMIGYASDGESHSQGEFVGAGVAGFFIWGTIAFIGTCWLSVPVIATLIATARYSVQRVSSRREERS